MTKVHVPFAKNPTDTLCAPYDDKKKTISSDPDLKDVNCKRCLTLLHDSNLGAFEFYKSHQLPPGIHLGAFDSKRKYTTVLVWTSTSLFEVKLRRQDGKPDGVRKLRDAITRAINEHLDLSQF